MRQLGEEKGEETMTLFMAVTNDEFELPVAVADTCSQLARQLGRSRNSVASGISHGYKTGDRSTRGRKATIRCMKVEVDDDN